MNINYSLIIHSQRHLGETVTSDLSQAPRPQLIRGQLLGDSETWIFQNETTLKLFFE